MITNEELYGTLDIQEVPKGVCNNRLTILKVRLKEELDKHYTVQNNQRINMLTKAINFWERLKEGEEDYDR